MKPKIVRADALNPFDVVIFCGKRHVVKEVVRHGYPVRYVEIAFSDSTATLASIAPDAPFHFVGDSRLKH